MIHAVGGGSIFFAKKSRVTVGKLLTILLGAYFAFFAIILILAYLKVFSTLYSSILATAVTAITGIISAFIANAYTEESKRIWNKYDTIWDKTLASTTLAVKDSKKMMYIVRHISKLMNPEASTDTSDSSESNKMAGSRPDKNFEIIQIGEWLLTEYPEFFKKDDKNINELALAIMNFQAKPADPKASTAAGFDDAEKIRSALLVILTAEFDRLYSETSEARTTLAVIAVNGEEMYKCITKLLHQTRDYLQDALTDPKKFEQIESFNRQTDADIQTLQELCWLELESTRTGARNSETEEKRRTKILKAEGTLVKARSMDENKNWRA